MTNTLRACPPESKAGCDLVLNGEYDIPGLALEHPIILDIGANIGAFSVWAADRWPGATIFAYEPHPEAFAHLLQNVGPEVQPHRCAISNADGKAPLYMGIHNLGESSLVNVGEQDMSKAGICKLVHARHLPECDILKVDTEGNERVILDNYPHLEKCRAVMLEWHSQEDRTYLRNKLLALGFQVVFDQEWNPVRGVLKVYRPPTIHLFVAVLSGGGKICVDNLTCMQRLMQVGPSQGVRITISNNGGTGVDRARNRSVAAALEDPTTTHFMFIDDDIVFEPQWIMDMIRVGEDVVAGAYPRKQISWEMLAAAVKAGVPPEELAEHSSDWIINYSMARDGSLAGIQSKVGDFMEVEEAGTGFLLCKRQVLDKMLAAYGPEMAYITDYPPRDVTHHMMFACQRDPASPVERAKRALLQAATTRGFDGLITAAAAYAQSLEDAAKNPALYGRYLTEDYAWCRLWRMLGGKIFLYLDAKLKHIGMMTYEGSARHYFKRAPAPEAQ